MSHTSLAVGLGYLRNPEAPILNYTTNLMRMKKLILCFLSVVQISSTASAQKNAEVGAAIAGGALAFGAIALEFHQMLEKLEGVAFNHIVENHPEYEAFRLKVLDLDGKKFSDIGAMSVVTFKITRFDKTTGYEGERSILMLLTSDGWINEYGINYSLIKWKMLSHAEWNKVFGSFVNMNTPVEVDTSNYAFHPAIEIKKRNFQADDCHHFAFGDRHYRIDTTTVENTLTMTFGKRGMSRRRFDMTGKPVYDLVLPFYPLRNDDYIVADYSDDFKLFANEKSMGLYVIEMNRSVLLKRELVGEIHGFLNQAAQTVW